MDYGDILKRGWQITWEHKFLWGLGFLAALGGNRMAGGGGNVSGNFGNFGGSGSGGSPGTTADPFQNPEQFFGPEGISPEIIDNVVASMAGIAIALVCCLFLFFIVMYFVRLAAEAGMIQSVFDIQNGQKSSFGKAFAAGRQHIGRIFGLRLTLGIPYLLVAALSFCGIAAGIVSLEEGGSGAGFGVVMILFFCLICLLIPYGIFESLLYPLGQRGIVLRGMSIGDALRHAWETLKAHAGEIILLGFIYVAIGIGIAIVTALIVLPIIAATALPVIFTIIDGGTPTAGQFGLIGLGVTMGVVIGAFINAIAVSFRSSSFTLAYVEFMNNMTKPPKADF